MSAPTSNAPTQPNASPSQTSRSLEADIALLTQLLSGGGSGDPEADGEDVAELLRKLEAAEDIADGMEERLDGIMDNLDELLSDLEARTGGGEGERERKEETVAVVVEEMDIAVVVATESGGGDPSEKE
ncbi:hypothetical protein OH76DRAFT_1359843 [Lentinus brumalis]|uniref:Uncharacterized protein n=1 Tax=Lentinus brumalis TaxID=2498619 RepID=A0A371CVJ3_9APHY|nr:hypothetical protein OH76DRAFT_1359843 [Polyporus brumalis]